MPSPTPGKESSGGDAESVLPDSASLGDDLHMNSKIFSFSVFFSSKNQTSKRILLTSLSF